VMASLSPMSINEDVRVDGDHLDCGSP
jgi:hypothetical protein